MESQQSSDQTIPWESQPRIRTVAARTNNRGEGRIFNFLPADFSFKKLSHAEDIPAVFPREIFWNLKRDGDGKIVTPSVWLNNNGLHGISGLRDVLTDVVHNVNSIRWINLSFNNLSIINSELLKFPNLRVLYFHGNKISVVSEVEKLSQVSGLRTLTLHGNPIELSTSYYRFRILSMVPQLQNIDFSIVSNDDRSRAKLFIKKKKVVLSEISVDESVIEAAEATITDDTS